MGLTLSLAAGFLTAISMPAFRARPKAILVLYLLVTGFVPYWVGVQVGPQFLPLAFVVAIWAAATSFDTRIKVSRVDWMMAALFSLLLVGSIVGIVAIPHSLAAAGSWLAPYVCGRNLAARLPQSLVDGALRATSLALAIFAIVEFTLDWHPFVNLAWHGGPGNIWRTIQYRSVFARSEGAMGHAISLGGAIALGVPFILLSRWSWRWRACALLVLGIGVALTFSRNALVAYALGIILCTLFARRDQLTNFARQGLLLAIGTVGALAVPVYLRVIDGGTGVLAASTDYRANYVSLIPSVKLFGLAGTYIEYSAGHWGWQSARYAGGVVVTLDNTILLTALQFGWIPMLLLLAVLTWIGVRLLSSGRGDPYFIAVCAQYFTIATVAMITQYPYLLWLLIGVAVSRVNMSSQTDAITSAGARDNSPPVAAHSTYRSWET